MASVNVFLFRMSAVCVCVWCGYISFRIISFHFGEALKALGSSIARHIDYRLHFIDKANLQFINICYFFSLFLPRRHGQQWVKKEFTQIHIERRPNCIQSTWKIALNKLSHLTSSFSVVCEREPRHLYCVAAASSSPQCNWRSIILIYKWENALLLFLFDFNLVRD